MMFMLIQAADGELWAVCKVNTSQHPMEGKLVTEWMCKSKAEEVRKVMILDPLDKSALNP